MPAGSLSRRCNHPGDDGALYGLSQALREAKIMRARKKSGPTDRALTQFCILARMGTDRINPVLVGIAVSCHNVVSEGTFQESEEPIRWRMKRQKNPAKERALGGNGRKLLELRRFADMRSPLPVDDCINLVYEELPQGGLKPYRVFVDNDKCIGCQMCYSDDLTKIHQHKETGEIYYEYASRFYDSNKNPFRPMRCQRKFNFS